MQQEQIPACPVANVSLIFAIWRKAYTGYDFFCLFHGFFTVVFVVDTGNPNCDMSMYMAICALAFTKMCILPLTVNYLCLP
jgi:hypothetical protein